jgi:zinc protease
MYVKNWLFVVAISSVANFAYATPHIEHWQTAEGARVLYVENHDIPMVDIDVSVPAGSSFDTPAKSGLAGMTQGMLSLGSEKLSEDEISSGMADIGAQLGGGIDQDRASLSLRTLSSEREKALAIMAQVLQHPVFNPEIFSREKKRLIDAIKEARTQPGYIASHALNIPVYGTHPYGLSTSGEVDSVTSLSAADLHDFYRTHYNARRAVVAIMGDVTRKQAEAIARQLTRELPTSDIQLQLPPVDLNISSSEQRIVHPATQSHILIAAPGVARLDPDYFPLYVGNYILGGGGFVSRLMNEVREKRGLAYSVYSYFVPLKQPGTFIIGLQTKKSQADQALQLARKTLIDFVKDGPTKAELTAAKQNIIGGFPLRIDSNSKILGYLSVIGFYNLPLTYLDDFTNRIDSVTITQIHDAFARHVHPDAMATVIVGAPVEPSGAGNK